MPIYARMVPSSETQRVEFNSEGEKIYLKEIAFEGPISDEYELHDYLKGVRKYNCVEVLVLGE